jgi:hypothetical protein
VEIDLVDECFIRAHPASVSRTFHEPTRWAAWWPGVAVSVYQDRGEEGLRWSASGRLTGSLEVWLEPFSDGVIVHHYVRASLEGTGTPRKLVRERARWARAWKQAMWDLKDALEAAREEEVPRTS